MDGESFFPEAFARRIEEYRILQNREDAPDGSRSRLEAIATKIEKNATRLFDRTPQTTAAQCLPGCFQAEQGA